LENFLTPGADDVKLFKPTMFSKRGIVFTHDIVDA